MWPPSAHWIYKPIHNNKLFIRELELFEMSWKYYSLNFVEYIFVMCNLLTTKLKEMIVNYDRALDTKRLHFIHLNGSMNIWLLPPNSLVQNHKIYSLIFFSSPLSIYCLDNRTVMLSINALTAGFLIFGINKSVTFSRAVSFTAYG